MRAQDKDGVLWKDKLIASARKEFEDARFERDPDIIARLLIGGQDALIAITDRMLHKARKLVDEEKKNPPGLGDGWAHSGAGRGRDMQILLRPFRRSMMPRGWCEAADIYRRLCSCRHAR